MLASVASHAQAPLDVHVLLDASGSMAASDGSVSRMARAQAALDALTDAVAPVEGVNLGLRVFGHEGDNTEAGKARSCRSTTLKVPLGSLDREQWRGQAATVRPAGWTPLALALARAGEDLPYAEGERRQVVVLVSDGEETCGGDPCAAAAALGADARAVHVVGYGLKANEVATLRCVAERSGGLMVDARDGAQLESALLAIVGQELRATGRTWTVPAAAMTVEPSAVVAGALDLAKAGAALGVQGAELGVEGARVGVEGARVGVAGAELGIETALGALEMTADVLQQSGDAVSAGMDHGRAEAARRIDDRLDKRTNRTRGEICAANQECNLSCSKGGCDMLCEAGSDCSASCSGGGCTMRCAANANCEFTCSGSGCISSCADTADCEMRCSGGGCRTLPWAGD